MKKIINIWSSILLIGILLFSSGLSYGQTEKLIFEDGFDSFATTSTTASNSGTEWFPTVVKVYPNGSAADGRIKMGSGSAIGSITSKSLDLSLNSGTFRVEITGHGHSTSEKTIEISVGSLPAQQIVFEKYGSSATSEAEVKYVEFTGGTDNSTIEISTITAAKRFYISKVRVYYMEAANPTASFSSDAAGETTITEFNFGDCITSSTPSKTVYFNHSDLTSDITLSPSESFTVSPTTVAIGAASPTELTLTFAPSEIKAYTGSISVAGGGLANEPALSLALKGAGISATTPMITVSTTAISDFSAAPNLTTDAKKITVNGSNLAEDITLSISGNDETSYRYSVNESVIGKGEGSITDHEVTITYTPTVAGSEQAAVLTLSSSGATSVTVNLSGTATSPVLGIPVAIEAGSVTANSFIANWNTVENATAYDLNVSTKGLGSEMVANGDFENGQADWTLEKTAIEETETPHSGSKYVKWVSGTGKIEQTVTTEIGKTYSFSFWYNKYTNTGNGLKNYTKDGATTIDGGTPALESASEWTKYEKIFTATTNNLNISVRSYVSSIIDDISLKEITWNNVGGYDPKEVTGATTYSVSGLNKNTDYKYSVVAKAANYTSSAASNVISVTTLDVCDSPTVLTSGELTHNSVLLSWTAPSPAPAKYAVILKAGEQTIKDTVATASCKISGLTPSTEYSYSVQSLCSATLAGEAVNGSAFTTLAPPASINPAKQEKSYTQTQGNAISETLAFVGANLGSTHLTASIKGTAQASAVYTVTPTDIDPAGLIEGAISLGISTATDLAVGTHIDTLLIKQGETILSTTILNAVITASNAPTVSITSPVDGSSVNAEKVVVSLTVTNVPEEGSHNVTLVCPTYTGTITPVAVTSATTEPIAFTLDKLSSGTYDITGKMLGAENAEIASSLKVGFTVALGTLTAEKVVLTPAADTFTSVQTVKITGTEGIEIEKIYYTLDGSAPSMEATEYNSETGISIAASCTLKYYVKATNYDPFIGSAAYVINLPKTNKVVLNPLPGIYSEPVTLEMTCATEDAVIRYTTDNTTPTSTSTVYNKDSKPVLSTTTTIKALAYKEGLSTVGDSIVFGNYTIINLIPANLPLRYDGGKSGLTEATGWYAENIGSDYSASPKIKFESSKGNISSLVLHFKGAPDVLAYAAKWNGSGTFGAFTVEGSKDGKEYSVLKTYNSENALTKDVKKDTVRNIDQQTRYIRWIYNTKVDGNVALGDISLTGLQIPLTTPTVNEATAINYLGFTANWDAVADAESYTLTFVGADVPAAVTGIKTNSYQVSGLAPEAVYTYNVTAIAAVGSGFSNSVASENKSTTTYAQPTNPTLTVVPSTVKPFAAIVNVEVKDTVILSAIKLTSYATAELSGTNEAMFAVSPAEIASVDGFINGIKVIITYNPTAVGSHSAVLTIASTGAAPIEIALSGEAIAAVVATPAFDPIGGTYTTAQNVVITSTTEGAAIFYTLDGNEPTIASTLYSAPIPVAVNTTIKAIATKANMTNSAIATAVYEIEAGLPELVGSKVFEETFVGFTGTSEVTALDSKTTAPGWTGEKVYAQYGMAKMGTGSVKGSLTTPNIDLSKDNGNFMISVFVDAWNGDNDTIEVWVNDTKNLVTKLPKLSNGTATALKEYRFSFTGGTATTKIKFASNSNASVYAGKGRFFIDSLRVFQVGAVVEKVATPTFTPAAGTYTTAQNVVIASTTEGAVVYFTVDGSTPVVPANPTPGSKIDEGNNTTEMYTRPITVSTNITLKAIAVKANMTTSDVATAAYVIDASAPVLTATPAKLDTFATKMGAAVEKTFKLSGANLTAAANLAISGANAAMFKIDKASVANVSGTIAATDIKVTYTPTASTALGVTHSAVLTITSTGATSLTIALNGTATSVANEENLSSMVSVYPNPSNGNFTVTTSRALQIEIYTLAGAKISSDNVVGSKEYNLPSNKSGVYLLRATTQNGEQITKKIVVR